MTPYEIDILLWYYTRACDYDDCGLEKPIWKLTVQRLIAESLLADSTTGKATYMLTDRGECYVKALLRVPLPDAHWVVRWPHD